MSEVIGSAGQGAITKTNSSNTHASFVALVAASVLGISKDEMQAGSTGEHIKVIVAAFSLSLLTIWVALGTGLVLSRNLDGPSWSIVPFACLVALIIYVIDRVFFDQKWTEDGKKFAREIGAQCDAPVGWMKNFLLRAALRVGLGVLIAFNVGDAYKPILFGPDTANHILMENQRANSNLIAEIGEAVADEIQAEEGHIDVLDDRAKEILSQQARELAVLQAARKARLDALIQERNELRTSVTDLSAEFRCLTRDRIAEDTGRIRCDGADADKGQGDNFEFARDMALEVEKERESAEGRIREIDVVLSKLQAADDPSGSNGSASTLLGQISTQRAQAMVRLNKLRENRDKRVKELVIADPRHVPMLQGVIAEGEALSDMASQSDWLDMRLALIFLFLVMLDLVATIAMTILPAPKGIVTAKVMAAEAAAMRAAAHYGSKQAKYIAELRKSVASYTVDADEIDKSNSNFRKNVTTRRHSEKAYSFDVEAEFLNKSKPSDGRYH